MKIGLEVEFFGTKKGNYVDMAIAGIPCDEYPILAEARGDPYDSVYRAVYSSIAEIERIRATMEKQGIKPVFSNWCERTPQVEEVAREIRRRGIHKQDKWENLYSLLPGKKNETHISAGRHVSITNYKTFHYTDKNKIRQEQTYNELFDFYKIFTAIEEEFAEEISASERVEGFYEIKPDSRIEYRSLPATLIWSKKFAQRLARCINEPGEYNKPNAAEEFDDSSNGGSV